MKIIKTFVLLFIIIFFIIISSCISYPPDSSYTMRFFVNGTGAPLEGEVSNNNNPLGYAQNGSFTTNIEKLRPGVIALNGTYEDQQFEFYFEFPASSLNYSSMGFSVRTDELKNAIFDASVLSVEELEQEVFSLVNDERSKGGIKILK
ncbi:MAG TPA: hypothetical protein VIO11_06595, partial [Candidatus Methanoperedens sp.]